MRPDLVRLDLAEQAEELAAEPALRVAPHGQRLDPQARVGAGTLLEEEGERGGRPGDHDRGRVRRAGDGVLEALDERAERNARELRQALELQQALVVRPPAPARVERPERAAVGGDDEPSIRAGEQPALRVDDRAARRLQVDRSKGLLHSQPRVRGAPEHLERPEAEREHGEQRQGDRGEPADADVERGAPVERCIDRRDGLDERQGTRQLRPAGAMRRGCRHGVSGGYRTLGVRNARTRARRRAAAGREPEWM